MKVLLVIILNVAALFGGLYLGRIEYLQLDHAMYGFVAGSLLGYIGLRRYVHATTPVVKVTSSPQPTNSEPSMITKACIFASSPMCALGFGILYENELVPIQTGMWLTFGISLLITSLAPLGIYLLLPEYEKEIHSDTL